MTYTTGSRRGPYAKTRGRVATVREVSYDLVRESGHRRVTLAEVARRARLSEAQLLYHFPSRDHLLVAALDHADSRTSEEAAARRSPGDDPEAALAAAVESRLSDRHVLRLFVTMSAEATDPDHPAHAWAARRREGVVAAYGDLLRRLQDRGWAHPDVDPGQFGLRLMALWDGLQVQWLVDPAFDLAAEVTAGFRLLAGHDAVPPAPPARG